MLEFFFFIVCHGIFCLLTFEKASNVCEVWLHLVVTHYIAASFNVHQHLIFDL